MNFVKKTVLFLTLFLISNFCFLVPKTHAQEFTFDKAYQDYVYTQTTYGRAYSDYERAKDFYLKNQTLTLKEDVRKKTYSMLRERDELERVYLAALRIKLIEIKVAVLPKLDSEIEWYKNHKESYKDPDPLENLFNKSKEVESRYKSDTYLVIYDTLFNITLGEMSNLRVSHEEVYKSIRENLDKNVSEGKLKIDPFNRWLTDIDLVIQNLKDNDEKAKKNISKIYEGSFVSPLSAYNSAVVPFVSSTTLLMQLNSFLGEFLTSLENQL
ncbi:MAG: hypothetical protein AAB535_02190 [Patescibacteria group bacterium]